MTNDTPLPDDRSLRAFLHLVQIRPNGWVLFVWIIVAFGAAEAHTWLYAIIVSTLFMGFLAVGGLGIHYIAWRLRD